MKIRGISNMCIQPMKDKTPLLVPDNMLLQAASLMRKGHHQLNVPATIEEVESFEQETGITIPQQYKEWLYMSNGGKLFAPNGLTLNGVGSEEHHIDTAAPDRADDNQICIGTFADGNSVFINGTDGSVAVYDKDWACVLPDEQYQDFISFLEALEKQSKQ